jgi:hypothetical protein
MHWENATMHRTAIPAANKGQCAMWGVGQPCILCLWPDSEAEAEGLARLILPACPAPNSFQLCLERFTNLSKFLTNSENTRITYLTHVTKSFRLFGAYHSLITFRFVTAHPFIYFFLSYFLSFLLSPFFRDGGAAKPISETAELWLS